MKRFNLYLPELYWDALASSDAVHWRLSVLAESRLAAVKKCQDKLSRCLQSARPECVYFSVFVGEARNPSAAASRLHPIQINREGKLR